MKTKHDEVRWTSFTGASSLKDGLTDQNRVLRRALKMLFAAMCLFLTSTLAWAAKPSGLLATWSFDEGKGEVTRDGSGNGNDGEIHGARYVKNGAGHCLEFNGEDNFVDCGKPSLNVAKALTLEAWVKPYSIPVAPANEPGIVGMGPEFNDSFGLTYFENGCCCFYISTGANNCLAKLGGDCWNHIVGTFDGESIHLYINGRLISSRPSKEPEAKSGGNLWIGKHGKSYFHGSIDDVKIYNRALSEEEIQSEYEGAVESKAQLQNQVPLTNPEVLEAKNCVVKVGKGGGMEISVGKDRYYLSSLFSYPGEKMGFNSLSDAESASEAAWKPGMKQSAAQIEEAAKGAFYTLKRIIKLDQGKIRIEDTLANIGKDPVAVIAQNNLAGPSIFREILLGGGAVSSISMVAENPTIFLSQKGSSLGMLAEDNIFRLQFEAASDLNLVRFGVKHFALDALKSYTLRWTIYPFERPTDYFDFVNAVRRDWNANFTIQGPFDWIPNGSPLLDDPDKLKAYLNRQKPRIVAFRPYYAYYDGASLTPAQYKEITQKMMRAFKKADPEIKCLGCIENNIVSYDRAKMKQGHLFDNVCRASGEYPLPLSIEQTRLLEQELPWKDSLVKNRDGRAMIEDCAPKSFIHPMVYSETGNYHTKYLMEQVKFLIEEVGFDGVYMDHFNMTFENTQRYNFSKWDGVTVDINPDTGRIDRKYMDAALVGIKPRKALCDYIFSKGKVFVVNTQEVANETQTMPVMHFEEVGSNADPNSLQPGKEPPLVQYIAKLQLGCPIALGMPSTNAVKVMKEVMLYLRHGLLYYNNETIIPETGPGSGEYGPINHMFPITPLELHKGWILGKERIVTAISINTLWEKKGRPLVRFFDMAGRSVDATGRYEIKPENSQWRVVLRLKDWSEFAVVE